MLVGNLILTRRLGQALTIGDPNDPENTVIVTVVEIRGDYIRLGFQAPPDVVIDRKEIWEQKQTEKKTISPLYEKG